LSHNYEENPRTKGYPVRVWLRGWTNVLTAHRICEFSSINPCLISREARLSLGNVANYSEICTYLLIYCTAAQSFTCFHSSAW